MKTQITAFFMAWGMFLSIPCPCKIWDEKARPWQLVYLPVAGLLVGALWALAAYALGSFDRLPALRAAVLAALPFLLTGFLHLDGAAENLKGLARRLVCRRVYDFPDACRIRGVLGF